MGTAESKQYLPLLGKPILVHTLELFERLPNVAEVVLVVGSDDVERCRGYVRDFGLTKVAAVIPGGNERQSSVHEGLRALSAQLSWVMVHDGVRPLAEPERIRECLAEAERSGGAVLAVPVKDTIKVADESGWIVATPDRRSLWAIQTPQAFRLPALREAYDAAERDGFLGTDDAMVAERAGIPVRIVEGSYTNIKITTPDDLQWAEEYLRRQEGEREKQ